MKKIVTWVLIADGTRARILENTGTGKGLKQVDGLEFAIDPMLAQELVSDRPGSYSSPSGGARGGMEPRTDPVDHRETVFAKSVAAVLDKKQQEGAFDRLVIAAAPIALGDIRKAISPAVKKTIIGELNKDLTNMPTDKLATHLDGVISV
jgi:protein required for attachment to host cells